MVKSNKGKRVFLVLLGLVLVAFAIIPTPDDVTVISPVVAFTVGIKLIIDGVR